MIEQLLRDKVNANLPLVMKGLQIYDYNMDGKVTRQDLRKVLENCCFKFTDQQFDKIWFTFNFQHNGLVSYKDFLRQLGVDHSKSALYRNTPDEANKWPRLTGQNKVMASQMMKSVKDDEKLMLLSSDEQIEAEFRRRMRSNYLKLKKAFLALDKHMDGSVSIEVFKSILSSFTLPMSDQTFLHLMERCGVKASGRVAWEIVLEKFQNPTLVGNGQTLPIRPNYRIYPSMESKTTSDWSTIWKELYKRVNTHFSSLKEAFLQIDKNRDGLVTKKEFRELIEKFVFHLDDGQFKELMFKIDPNKTNKVDYHTFLRLFEEKETKDGHKWLRSVHKYNRKSKPTCLSWETVEELLREKIAYYWKNVADWLKYYDSGGTGYLSKGTLKKVIDLQVLPVSDEHFESLISKCTDFHRGKVSYKEFLGRLGVDVSPGDFTGLSSQIIDGSSQTEMKRQLDQVQRHDQITTNQCHRTSHMTADEVITLFKDKVTQLTPELRKAFLKNDKKNKGQISQKQFRMILAELGIYMSDGQFSGLMSRLNLPNGNMQYLDFVNNFGSSLQQDGATGVVDRLNNHRVNAIRGDEYGMTAVEAGAKLKQKLRENFSNLREAFDKFDDLHLGCLSKSGFRRMLDSFMIFMSNVEYDKFCDFLGIMPDSKISYLEFLERFEPRDSIEGHKWLSSVHRFNETHKPKPLTASEAHTMLAQKAHKQWNDLSTAFRSINSNGNGIITKPELQETLGKFVMPMEPTEFKKLWKRLDTDNKNYISHQDFLQRLGALEYATGDNGPSGSILDANYQFLKNHSRKQQEKHEDITWNQANLAMNLSVEAVERLLRDKIRDSYSDFYTAFRKYDTNKLGCLSMADLQKILNEQHIFINDKQFFALMNRIGLPTYGSSINYAEFLNVFEDGRKSSYGQRTDDIKMEKYETLSPEDAEVKLKMKLKANINDVFKTLAAFDKDGSGKVQVTDFRRVLDMFCFVLTDPQWRNIQTGLTITADQYVNYKDFLSQFVQMEANNCRVYIQSPESSPTSDVTLPAIDKVTERIHQAVFSHYHNILREFEGLDPDKTGSVTLDELRDVVSRNIMVLSDQQFEKLSTLCPETEQNRIDYNLFMKMFSEDMQPLMSNPTPLPPAQDRGPSQMLLTRPSTSRSQRSSSRLSSRSSFRQSRSCPRSGSRMSTPMINAESAETQVKDVVFRHWHEMQKQCRDMDVDGSGTIRVQQFHDLLQQFGVTLPPSDFNDLVTKYDISENGRFCYGDFIKYFLLTVKPSEKTTLMNREKMVNKLYNSEAPIQEDEEKEDSLRRIEECVRQNWKEMRREFRNADPETRGRISTDEFRRTLRKFNINISENEFHLLQDSYDKDFLDMISYNDFLKDYLQRISQ